MQGLGPLRSKITSAHQCAFRRVWITINESLYWTCIAQKKEGEKKNNNDHFSETCVFKKRHTSSEVGNNLMKCGEHKTLPTVTKYDIYATFWRWDGS